MEIMEELDDKAQFTEMEAVVTRLSNNKASGRDAIPADLIKAGRQVLLSSLYSQSKVLAKTHSSTGNEGLKYNHSVQKQGRQR